MIEVAWEWAVMNNCGPLESMAAEVEGFPADEPKQHSRDVAWLFWRFGFYSIAEASRCDESACSEPLSTIAQAGYPLDRLERWLEMLTEWSDS